MNHMMKVNAPLLSLASAYASSGGVTLLPVLPFASASACAPAVIM